MAKQKIDVIAAGTFFHVIKLTEGKEALYVVKDFGHYSDVFDTEEGALGAFNELEGAVAQRIEARR